MTTGEQSSDDDLMASIAGGDREAFAALYRRRQRDVYRFALHMTASAAAADDVTQDTFVAVIHDASGYVPGRSSVVSWLLGIARNYVRRRVDRERRHLSLSEEATAAERDLVVETDPLAGLDRDERLDGLRRALGVLPTRYREAVVLCDLEELSYAEAARAMGCAIGTVRSRLHRGRAMLAARLRPGEARGCLRMHLTGDVI